LRNASAPRIFIMYFILGKISQMPPAGNDESHEIK